MSLYLQSKRKDRFANAKCVSDELGKQIFDRFVMPHEEEKVCAESQF